MDINKSSDELVIWRFSDGKPGHDSQSKGLVGALQKLTACQSYDVDVGQLSLLFPQALLKKFSPGKNLPAPHLLIGAGHRTHMPLLCARHARGGRAIVLMKPSLPANLFDCCIVPEHDEVKAGNKIILSQGVLNSIQPSNRLNKNHGLILIGGESRHFHWYNETIMEQLRAILESTDKTWTITDSRRTPGETRQSLGSIATDNAVYVAHEECGPDWIKKQLETAASIWVSRDSMSMIYEALSAGGAVGLLDLQARQDSRLVNATQMLIEKKMLTPFSSWQKGTELPVDGDVLREANRCAKSLLEKLQPLKEKAA